VAPKHYIHAHEPTKRSNKNA